MAGLLMLALRILIDCELKYINRYMVKLSRTARTPTFFGAALGTTTLTTCGLPIATGTIPTIVTTILGFGALVLF